MEKEANIITRGTLRVQDLLESYASELEALSYENGDADKYSDLIASAYAVASEIEQLNEDASYEEGHYILEDLREALNDNAPEEYEFRNCEHTPDEIGWFPIEEEGE